MTQFDSYFLYKKIPLDSQIPKTFLKCTIYSYFLYKKVYIM